MPKIDWSEENRRYSLCFFPLIGAVIGGLLLLWHYLCEILFIGSFLYAAGAVVIIMAVTGGIHLDGFCDTCDARASWGDRQRKLEILTDSHIGAFAAIKLGCYLIAYTALITELSDFAAAGVTACTFVLSRSLSGLAAVTFKAAKKVGTLQSFTVPAHKSVTVFVLSFTAALSCIGMIAFSPAMGAAAAFAAVMSMLYYRYMAYREFGGITGDLAGWFLQVCELSCAAAAVLAYKIMEVL